MNYSSGEKKSTTRIFIAYLVSFVLFINQSWLLQMNVLLLTVHWWLTWTINSDLLTECIRKLPLGMGNWEKILCNLPSFPTKNRLHLLLLSFCITLQTHHIFSSKKMPFPLLLRWQICMEGRKNMALLMFSRLFLWPRGNTDREQWLIVSTSEVGAI